MQTTISPYGSQNTYDILGAEAAETYALEDRIGVGTFADVYRAKHNKSREWVAIKVLRAPYSRDTLARFKKELRILQQIDHPNIVRLIEDRSNEDIPYCVMEYCTEDSLMALMNQQHGGLSMGMIAQLFPQIVRGVEALHQQGIVHRDLKPANILLTKTEQGLLPKISDFGIAKRLPTDIHQQREFTQIDGGRTLDGTSLGTFGYLAPELLGYANEANQRSDIFSLGAILYEMIACINPFDAPDFSRTALEDNNAVCRYTLSVDNIPLRYHPVIRDCLQRDPAHRFGSCAEVLRAFSSPPAPTPDTRIANLQTAMLGGFVGLLFSFLLMWFLFPSLVPNTPRSPAPSPLPSPQSAPTAVMPSPIQLEPLPSRPSDATALPSNTAVLPIQSHRPRKRRTIRRPPPRRLSFPAFQAPATAPQPSKPDPYQDPQNSVAKDTKDAFNTTKTDQVFQDNNSLKKDTEDAFSRAKRPPPKPSKPR